MVDVLIGIQARSGSKRLPGKSLMALDDSSDTVMVDYVVGAAKNVAAHLNKTAATRQISANIALLIPHGDQLKDHICDVMVMEGPENDVLTRYALAFRKLFPKYVVRITGDCPLIKPALITKHIIEAVKDNLDYCSNAYEDMRTFVDGYDVEVISDRALRWLDQNASQDFDREHVTTLLRREKPSWAKFGIIVSDIDLSHLKFSVDTYQDLEDVRNNKELIKQKIERAQRRGYAIYRY